MLVDTVFSGVVVSDERFVALVVVNAAPSVMMIPDAVVIGLVVVDDVLFDVLI